MNKSTAPRVSIGLPLYNAENYLAETLDSILNQTFTDFELIICDNASTDNTEEICRAYATKDTRIQYHRNPTNLGAAPNYNRTFDLAIAPYFKWVAHDDPIAPTLLEHCVHTLDETPQAIMAYAKTILIDEDDNLIEYHEDGFDLRSPHPHQRLRQYFHSSAWCHPVFGLIRADILKHTGLIGSFPSSDKVLLSELAVLGQCHEYPEHLAYRRLHPEISTRVHVTDESMQNWFDTRTRKTLLTPRWRRFIEHFKAINRAKLSLRDRLLCYGELFRFYVNIDRVRGVFKDLGQVGKLLTRPFNRP